MLVDEKYYQVIPKKSISEKITIHARDIMYHDFLKLCAPTPESTVLDFGASDVVGDAANVLERNYSYPEKVTAVGLGAGDAFKKEYPLMSYVQITANSPLPFEDKHFDIVSSNAVLEHVGSAENQRFFIAEAARVGKQVFLSVPNKMFPVEHHTAIPLLHWMPRTFRLACQAFKKTYWAEPKNLILMSRDYLDTLVPHGLNYTISYSGIKIGRFSSNIVLHIY